MQYKCTELTLDLNPHSILINVLALFKSILAYFICPRTWAVQEGLDWISYHDNWYGSRNLALVHPSQLLKDLLYIFWTYYWLFFFFWIKYWCLFLTPVYYFIQCKLRIIWDYSHVNARLVLIGILWIKNPSLNSTPGVREFRSAAIFPTTYVPWGYAIETISICMIPS